MLAVGLRIVPQEDRQGPRMLGRVGATVGAAGEHAVNPHLGPPADILGHLALGQRLTTEVGLHEIDRGRKISGGVEQGAVEIDQDGLGSEGR